MKFKINPKQFLFKTLFFGGIVAVGLSQLTQNENNVVNTGLINSAHAKPVVNKPKKQNKTPKKSPYTLIRWDDLLPANNLKALQDGPSTPPTILDGSAQDVIDSPLSMKIAKPKDAYERALVSVKVVEKYNKKKVKLPGFIVPIDIQGEGITKTFFFVPFFGACLHLPPPPPNQIVYATFKKGYRVEDLYQPYYIEATMYTQQKKNDIATSAYLAKVDKIYEYVE